MQLTILTFGITRDIVGSSQATIELEDGATVAQLKEKLAQQYPKLEELKSLLVAVNSDYSKTDIVLKETDEIALIPPVSGG